MKKHGTNYWSNLIGALAVLLMVSTALAADETWDVEFDGKGYPTDTGFEGVTVNSSTFNPHDKFTNLDVMVGWLTAGGNPGGYFHRPEPRLTQSGGWTAQWRLALEASASGAALNFNDDVGLLTIIYDEPANSVTIQDGATDAKVTANVELGDHVAHVYRLVRQPRAKTVELYIDENPQAAATITPARAADHGQASQLKRVAFAHSELNAAWDYFRYRRGATTPQVPVPVASEPTGDGPRIFVVSPAINNQSILPELPLPSVCASEKVMKVLCARGEFEPASFLIDTDQPLKQVTIAVGPLQGPAGALPNDSVDVRLVQKFYRPVTWQCVAMPWVLVHDPAMLKIVDGSPKWMKDVTAETWKSPGGQTLEDYKAGYSKINALQKELIDAETMQAVDVADREQFWLTVRVPDDAAAGTYTGQITVSSASAPVGTLELEVMVPAFDLLPPKFEYSVYYPTMLERADMTDTERERYHPVSEEQYLAEARNMAEHGCLNPCLYAGSQQDETGTIHFTQMSRILDLRERAGLPRDVTLYLMDGAGMILKEGPLTEQEKYRNIEVVKATVAWAKERGYRGAMFMGADEYAGERLRNMRDSYASVVAGGSGIWVAGGADLMNFMSDVVAVPIFAHPGAMAVDSSVQWQVDSVEWLLHPEDYPNWDPQILLLPDYQQLVQAAHQHGNKLFTYFDPQGGQPFPEYHRRHRGLGLWKTGFDGTMTWAYIHIWEPTPRLNDPQFEDGVKYSPNSFVLRGPRGVLDTLAWEGYREGYDDARYLATLQDAIAKAKSTGKHAQLVAETQRWMENTGVDVNLDEWRREMARRTELLLEIQQ